MLNVADTLSRAPIESEVDKECEEEVEAVMEVCILQLPATSSRLNVYATAQQEDSVCSRVREFCQQGWPEKKDIEVQLIPYWKERAELSIGNNLLLYRRRIVVPEAMRRETLEKIHEGHQGISRCRLRAGNSVWWPGLSQEIKAVTERCFECAKENTTRTEPLINTRLPKYPWQQVASDLFELQGKSYLVVVDYFSRYPEVMQLTSTTSSSVIRALKARHGLPETLISDNGPQYTSWEFVNFVKEYNIQHVTSSPHFPRSNGLAERTVQTIKGSLKKSKDLYMTLLTYRTTPLSWCSVTPAELLMGRCLRTNLPQIEDKLRPRWPDLEEFRKKDEEFKRKQKYYFDKRHRVLPIPELPKDAEVWVTTRDQQQPGRVISPADTPRSYWVGTQSGQIRRNRQHLRNKPSAPISSTVPDQETSTNRVMTRTQTGTAIRSPEWFTPGR